MIHELKIKPEYLEAIMRGHKTFEVRRNDRNYQVGDTLKLRGFNGQDYVGGDYTVKVTYVLKGGQYGIDKDYCILGIARRRNYKIHLLKVVKK